MSLEVLRSTVGELVDKLVSGEYELAVRGCAKSRLTGDDLRRVIHDYGRTLIPAPADAYEDLDAIPVRGVGVPTWSVRVPLWTREEGRSDLTLELTIALGPAEPEVEIDDLRVL